MTVREQRKDERSKTKVLCREAIQDKGSRKSSTTSNIVGKAVKAVKGGGGDAVRIDYHTELIYSRMFHTEGRD